MKRTSSLSFLALSIFLLQINGHLMKRNSTRTESSLQESRGRRNAHVVSENPAWAGHGPTAPTRELFPRLCEHLGKYESRASRLHVYVRHRPLNIEQKGISLYQFFFEEYQKSASYRFFIITFYTLYQKNSESKLHRKVSIEF